MNSRSTTSLNEEPTEEFTDLGMENVDERNERTLEDQIKISYGQPEGVNTREILQKIKEINQGLQKPKRHQMNYNTQPYAGGYILDKAILEKLQQIIAAGKLNGLSGQQKVSTNEDNNYLNRDDIPRYENARALNYVQPGFTTNALGNQAVGYVPLPYVTNLPVVVMPSINGVYGTPATNGLNSLNADYTRQAPSLPSQIPWPLAPFFPILVKDPLLHYLQGGNWENIIEYGQSADVCNRKQKFVDTSNAEPDVSIDEVDSNDNVNSLDPVNVVDSRQGRKLKKRTISKSPKIQKLDADVTKLFSQKPLGVRKPVRKEDPPPQHTKTGNDNEGDLKFPFGGDFNWFGERKPVAPSPGFFINRLKVRRGGVAIAGPGGVATAGRGGTAIVGPGGLAYTQPGGLAVAGPAARVVALASDADLNSVVSRLQHQSAIDGSVSRLLQVIPEGKIVARGPIIYYHPYKSE